MNFDTDFIPVVIFLITHLNSDEFWLDLNQYHTYFPSFGFLYPSLET